MSKGLEDFRAALKAGDTERARVILLEEMAKSEFSPDSVDFVRGKSVRFTKKGKEVECGEDGVWRLKSRS